MGLILKVVQVPKRPSAPVDNVTTRVVWVGVFVEHENQG